MRAVCKTRLSAGPSVSADFAVLYNTLIQSTGGYISPASLQVQVSLRGTLLESTGHEDGIYIVIMKIGGKVSAEVRRAGFTARALNNLLTVQY
jgi:hypothetical protein